jgi:LysM repeat protein
MALDLRVSGSSRCRSWLEGVLVGLEARGVLEAARERRPPHYHVVVFPRDYASYLQGRATPGEAQLVQVAATATVPAEPAPQEERYRVRSGDTLWGIARRHQVSVSSLQRHNGLHSSSLRPGQTLSIPAR